MITIGILLNSGPGAPESWRRDLRAPGPLFNTNSIVVQQQARLGRPSSVKRCWICWSEGDLCA